MVEEFWEPPTCRYMSVGRVSVCTKCDYGEDLPEIILEHEPDEGTVIYEGNCMDPTEYSHKCVRCGCNLDNTYGEINPDNHNWAIDRDTGEEYCAYGCGK